MKLFSTFITAVVCICIAAAAVEDNIAIPSSNTKSLSKQIVEGRTSRGLARTRANRNRVYSPFYRMGGSKSSKSKSSSKSSKSSKSCKSKSSKTESSSKSKSSTPKSSSKSSTSKSSKSSSCKSSSNNKKKNRKNRKNRRRKAPWGD